MLARCSVVEGFDVDCLVLVSVVVYLFIQLFSLCYIYTRRLVGVAAVSQVGLLRDCSFDALWPFVYKYRLLERSDYLLIIYLFLNFIHSFARQSVPVLIVNVVGIPTGSQRLLTRFVRRPDDVHLRAEICNITHNNIRCVWRKLFYHFIIEL